MATAKGEKIGVNVSVTREVALTNSKGSSPNVLYFPTDSDSFVFNGKEYGEIASLIYRLPGNINMLNFNVPINEGIINEVFGTNLITELNNLFNNKIVIDNKGNIVTGTFNEITNVFTFISFDTRCNILTLKSTDGITLKSRETYKWVNLNVVNNLDSTEIYSILSANQGTVLNSKISAINQTLKDTPKVYAINGSINAWSQLPTSPAIQDSLETLFDAPELFVAAAQDKNTIIVDQDGNPIDVTIEGESYDDVTLYTIDLYKNVRNDNGESGTVWLEIIAFKRSDNTWEWSDDNADIIYEEPTYLSDKIISVKDTNWRLTLDSFTTGNISNNLVSALKGGSVTSIKANVDAGKTYMYNGIPLSIQVDSSYNWYIQFMYNGKIIMQNFNTTDNRGGMKSININELGS